MELKRVNVQISGRVQGVGYRYFVQEKAAALGVAGWARNLPDGNVEVEAEGPQPALEILLKFLECGPTPARVAHVEVDWQPADRHFESFEIR